jgi:peptide/nickel transport system permease protein
MPPIVLFVLRRMLGIPVTLLIITLILYAIAMLTPVEARAMIYFPDVKKNLTEEEEARIVRMIIDRHGLDQPFPVQYGNWLANLAQGQWGWSPTINAPVLSALLVRTPATAELTLYSLAVFIPLGLAGGVLAGWQHGRGFDHRFRTVAFVATSVPPFILALMLLGLFYVGLYWFPPERLGIVMSQTVRPPGFTAYTGLYTLDGLLNNRLDVTVDAARHLVLPVITLSLLHWATLARVTRAAIIDELGKDYLVAGRARGLGSWSLMWGHAFPNTVAPALTSTALSAASLVTGVFVVETIYNFHGISELATGALRFEPDIVTALGFAIYSVLIVLALMLVLDLLQAFLDPRIREGLLE